jgi:biopolymer transport protein ExbD
MELEVIQPGSRIKLIRSEPYLAHLASHSSSTRESILPMTLCLLVALTLLAFGTITLVSMVCGIVLANANEQQLSPALSLAAYPSPPTAQTSAAKLRLNGEDVGTTADTSVLAKRLIEIFAQRLEKGPFTDERARSIDGTVFIRAENTVQYSEVHRVIEAVSRNHGIPWLAAEVKPAGTGNHKGNAGRGKGARVVPRSQMLVVSVGSPGGQLISGGIRLVTPDFTLHVSARRSIPKEFTVVEVFKDSDYVIGEQSIPSSALRKELQTRLREKIDKRVVILTRSDSEIRWSSFIAVATAARQAGAEMIQTHNLIP